MACTFASFANDETASGTGLLLVSLSFDGPGYCSIDNKDHLYQDWFLGATERVESLEKQWSCSRPRADRRLMPSCVDAADRA